MQYFSDREQGLRPRIEEEVSQSAWEGIIAKIKSLIIDGSFGYRYPLTCSDGDVPYGCNEHLFSQALTAEILDITWPLNREQLPPTHSVLDLIEFCYREVGKPIIVEYHGYFRHNHLRFEHEEGQVVFREDINRILSRNSLAYELDSNGLIQRLPPEEVRELLKSPPFNTGNTELNSLLETARKKYLDPDITVRKEALEKLWDAWERLKTLEPGADKRASTKALLDKGAAEPTFRETLEKEARELTEIGNTFNIRHSETTQVSLDNSVHVDYLFHRLFSLIILLLKSSERM